MDTLEILEIIIILSIVFFIIHKQYKQFKQNQNSMNRLRSLLDGTFVKIQVYIPVEKLKTISWTDVRKNLDVYKNNVGCDEITLLYCADANENEENAIIEDSINTYLLRNRGAACDFYLIRDIVERNSSTLINEIDTQTPVPLYYGLMGTIIGIVVGLGTIGLRGFIEGDFNKFIENIGSEILPFLISVAIAMVASFCGILFTTLSAINSKTEQSELGARKDKFYSWFQADLLPVVSNSLTGVLSQLGQNLALFNKGFKNNVANMNQGLSNMNSIYAAQTALVNQIQSLNITSIATANVKVLRNLQNVMPSLTQFAAYMTQNTEYLNAVKTLSQKLDEYSQEQVKNSAEYSKQVNGLISKIDEHLEKTKALEDIAAFYKEEGEAIKSNTQNAKDAITSSVNQIDSHLQNALTSLQNTTVQGTNDFAQAVNTMNTNIETAINSITISGNTQINSFNEYLTESVEALKDFLNGKKNDLDAKLQLLDLTIKSLKDSSENSKTITNLKEMIEKQKADFENIEKKIEELNKGIGTISHKIEQKREQHVSPDVNLSEDYKKNLPVAPPEPETEPKPQRWWEYFFKKRPINKDNDKQ